MPEAGGRPRGVLRDYGLFMRGAGCRGVPSWAGAEGAFGASSAHQCPNGGGIGGKAEAQGSTSCPRSRDHRAAIAGRDAAASSATSTTKAQTSPEPLDEAGSPGLTWPETAGQRERGIYVARRRFAGTSARKLAEVLAPQNDNKRRKPVTSNGKNKQGRSRRSDATRAVPYRFLSFTFLVVEFGSPPSGV